MSREVAAHGHDSSGLTGCQHPDGVLSGHRQAKEGRVEGPRLVCRGALRAPFTSCSPSPVQVTPAALSMSAGRPPETTQPPPQPAFGPAKLTPQALRPLGEPPLHRSQGSGFDTPPSRFLFQVRYAIYLSLPNCEVLKGSALGLLSSN